MRLPPSLLVLLALSAGLAPAAAHPSETLLEEYLNHTHLRNGTLGPGEAMNATLAWEGAPLQEGWLILWSGHADGTLRLSLTHDDASIEREWSGGLGTAVVPATGTYELVLENPGDRPVSFGLHYDQTCDCTGKMLPQPGALWFQVDAPERAPVDLRFSIVPSAQPNATERGDITGMFTVREFTEGPWEEGRQVAAVPFTIRADDEGRLHVVHVPFTSGGGRHVVLLELEHDQPGWAFQVKPAWVVGEPEEAPGPGLLPVIGVLAAAGHAALRQRQRP